MSVQTSYPGVYVQEVPSGVRTITGVSTSIGLFIGASNKGPIRKPIRCFNYSSFKDKFVGATPGTSQLAQYVRLFFQNGGTDCYVMRLARNAAKSAVTLRNEAGANALILTAKDSGLAGEDIRAVVTYSGAQPESVFNMELYLWETEQGRRDKKRREVWRSLSMDPASPRFAPTFITQNSQLVDASLPGVLAALTQGFSQSGRPVPQTGAGGGAFKTAWGPILGSAATANRFRMSIDGSDFFDVDLNDNTDTPAINIGAMLAGTAKTDLAAAIKGKIIAQSGIPGLDLDVDFIAGPPPPGPATETNLLRFKSKNNGDVYITSSGTNDLAAPLMLGTEYGGLEVSSHAVRRPAPNGITLLGSNPAVWLALAGLAQNAFSGVGTGITLDQFLAAPATGTMPFLVQFTDLVTNAPASPFYMDNNGASLNGNCDGVRDKLRRIADAINAKASAERLFRWNAQVSGYRLTISATEVVDDNFLGTNFAVNGLPAANFYNNVKAYSLGAAGLGIGARQVSLSTGSDGVTPQAAEYDDAYDNLLDKEVDLFNLLVLPPDEDAAAVPVQQLYGSASVYCQKRRAFLLMDAPTTWTDAQTASTGVAALRVGLVKDYSAVFFPQITIKNNNLNKDIGAAGALAGLFARTDSSRGVWKAPAGIEGDLRDVVGVKTRYSDAENGILNPRAINTIRSFPSGIVNWGARTNFGDDDTPHDYKYIPVRRTALFIEESLYRGLKWVVFEPNDEPLWAQIRLNVGAFMHNLFRQGAFQGTKKSDAYFVKCDSETTTQNDINLGIVNIWVGFAPLKPAEFVVLYLQQIAGNIQV